HSRVRSSSTAGGHQSAHSTHGRRSAIGAPAAYLSHSSQRRQGAEGVQHASPASGPSSPAIPAPFRQYSSSLAIARLLEQVHLRPLSPVRPPPAIVGPTLRPLPRDLVARLAGRRAAERAGDGQAWFTRHRSRSSLST